LEIYPNPSSPTDSAEEPNLVWIIDGRGFRKNFDIFHILPAPDSEIAKDLIWFKATRQLQGAARGQFWRLSENADHLAGQTQMVTIQFLFEIAKDVETAYRGHHQYDWVRPRKTWLDATCPVYIDFGDEHLVRLEKYGNYGLPCVKYVSKRKFIHDASVETSGETIATKFYRIEK